MLLADFFTTFYAVRQSVKRSCGTVSYRSIARKTTNDSGTVAANVHKSTAQRGEVGKSLSLTHTANVILVDKITELSQQQ